MTPARTGTTARATFRFDRRGRRSWTDPLGPPPDSALYLARHPLTGHVKVGRSRRPFRRMWDLGRASGAELVPLLVVHGIGHRVEPQLHREFAPYRVQGEWYALPDDEVAALVKTYGRLNVVNERRRRPWLDRMYRLSRKNVRA